MWSLETEKRSIHVLMKVFFFFSYLLAGCSSSETKRGERRIKEGLIIFVSVLALSVVVNGNKSVVVRVTASLDFLLWGNKACEML